MTEARTTSLIRRLLVRLDDTRIERDRLRGELERVRALHHTPYADAEHQGGNCVDMLMAQAAELAKARRELEDLKLPPQQPRVGHRNGCTGCQSCEDCTGCDVCEGEPSAYPNCWTAEDIAADRERIARIVRGQ